jgi:hypothetical protein
MTFSNSTKERTSAKVEADMRGSRLCVKLLPVGIIDKLVIHVNINKLTKHEFIPLEGGFGQYDKKWGDSYYGQGRK